MKVKSRLTGTKIGVDPIRGKSNVYFPAKGVGFQCHRNFADPNWSSATAPKNATIPTIPAEIRGCPEMEFKR